MSAFRYTARKNLISGHTAGIAYDIEDDMEILLPNYREQANRETALAGNSETLLHRIDHEWQLQTNPLSDLANQDYDQWTEFLTSAMTGESFTFDAYGTIASSHNIVNAELVPGSVRTSRVSNISQSSVPSIVYAFRIRVL